MSLTRHAYAILGLATVLTAVSFSSTHARAVPPGQPTQNVAVVNTPTVTVGSLPAVQIASGQNVGVSSLPAVQLGTGANVSVNNTSANPVPVQAVSDRNDVNLTTNGFIQSDLFQENFAVYTVPANKYFVLTDLSVGVTTSDPGDVASMTLSGTGLTGSMTVFLSSTAGLTSFGGHVVTSTLTGAHWVFAPGSVVTVGVTRTDDTNTWVVAPTLGGYLMDNP